MSDEQAFAEHWIYTFDWHSIDADDRAARTLERAPLQVLQREAFSSPLDQQDGVARLGRYISALRRARGWSRPALARRAGIDPLAVLFCEHGLLSRQELTESLQRRLAHALGLPLRELQSELDGRQDHLAADQHRQRPVDDQWFTGARAANQAHLERAAADAPALPVRLHSAPAEAGAALVFRERIWHDERLLAVPVGGSVRARCALMAEDSQGGRLSLQIQLVDAAGEPVPGLAVSLRISRQRFSSAAADSAGRIEFSDLPRSVRRRPEALVLAIAP